MLAVAPSRIDAHRFRRLLEDARKASDDAARSSILRKALSLWRGPPLADFAYEPFAQRDIASLHELRLGAIEDRVEADLALGRHGELVAELEELAGQHPFRERLRVALLLALYRSGRQADALEVYRRAREVLIVELGIEPGPALRDLEQAILRQDPSLDLPAPAAVALPPDGRPRVEEHWLASERRTVSVVFVDLAPALDAAAGFDPEARRRLMGRAAEMAAEVLRSHGGSVEQFVGEVLMGLFGLPIAHEDDALRAVRATVELRGALSALNDELERDLGIRLPLRSAVEAGEVAVGPTRLGHSAPSGVAINVAAGLLGVAAEGDVLVGAAAREILREAATLEPLEPGRPGTPAAWRLVDLVPGAPAISRRLDAPMVGRTLELTRLHDAFERTVRTQTAFRFSILGDAGIGKTRLAAEFADSLRLDARVLTGHCLAYGEGITFWPLREVVQQAAGPHDGPNESLTELLRGEDDGEWIAQQISGAIGLHPQPGRPDELFPAVRRFYEVLAERGPLVVVFEDLHWAEPTLLDLIEYLAGWARGPLFLLCVARPELLEERPAWGAGSANADTLFLDPLGSAETEQLISERLGGGALPTETRMAIGETAQGNPLFVEQLVAAFAEEGAIALPASLSALLAARLDRLGPAERDLLRCAAVVGMDFTDEALSALVPEQARPFVERHLETLERKLLIRGGRPQAGFVFRHVLIQVASYRSMAREDRADLHERYADWLERRTGAPPPELDALLGYHLGGAVEERRAVGLDDEHAAWLAVRAGEHLSSAGRRAFAQVDMGAAGNLLSRARSLLLPQHPQRAEVLQLLAVAYPMLGRHADADAVAEELQQAARAREDPALEQAARLERTRLRLIIGPYPSSLDEVRDEAERARDFFRSVGDDARAAYAAHVLGIVHILRGDPAEAERVARVGLADAERSGHPREELALRWWIAWAVRAGEMPVAQAIPVCEEMARWRGSEHPGVLFELARLHAMVGHFGEGRRLLAHARVLIVERLRMRRPLLFAARAAASVELQAGDLEAAERELRAALERSREMYEPEGVAKIAAALARALVTAGRVDEAEVFAEVSERQAPSVALPAQALWRAATARVMASRGRATDAEPLAREAVHLAPAGMPNLRADLTMDLAEVLRAGGDIDGAASAIGDAIALYERKGNLVAAARARSLRAGPAQE
ncbi:MAG: BTAD domain-containing putative transcriptional regulator [Actinomycetota bacterium]